MTVGAGLSCSPQQNHSRRGEPPITRVRANAISAVSATDADRDEEANCQQKHREIGKPSPRQWQNCGQQPPNWEHGNYHEQCQERSLLRANGDHLVGPNVGAVRRAAHAAKRQPDAECPRRATCWASWFAYRFAWLDAWRTPVDDLLSMCVTLGRDMRKTAARTCFDSKQPSEPCVMRLFRKTVPGQA